MTIGSALRRLGRALLRYIRALLRHYWRLTWAAVQAAADEAWRTLVTAVTVAVLAAVGVEIVLRARGGDGLLGLLE